MNTNRWKQVSRLYHSALELPENQRSSYLDEACAGDDSLRQSVESLLAADRADRALADSPTMTAAARLLPTGSPGAVVPEIIEHYGILRRLGAGGIGEVYLASDLILDRQVAIKVLRPESLRDEASRARFLREARAVATLNHTGIATIYEAGDASGLPYLVMEYVRGRTLHDVLAAGPLDEPLLLNYARQITAALAHAHDRGIVHRDIKSANMLVTPEGVIKLLDFGLARILRPTDDTVTALTAPGAWLGTLQYAAPESLAGSPVDHRGDLYSLGVVLYEMAAGTVPYRELSGAALVSAVLRGDAPPLSRHRATVSPALANLIERAMAVRPDHRFQTAAELLAALHGLAAQSAPSPPPRPADVVVVAIVEFRNVSSDPTIDWLGTGIADTLGAELQKIPSLRVVSRHRVREAAERLGTESPDADLGRAVKAHWLVSGSYQRSENRLRITPGLLYVPNEEVVALGKVDGRWEEIFEVQDRVVQQVVEHLPLQTDRNAMTHVAVPETLRVEAYEQYALGRQKMMGLGKDSLEEAREHFERAVALDAHYAAAYSALGCVHAFRFIRRTDPEDLTRATRYLERALTLDPELGEPYPFLCYIYMRQSRAADSIAAGQKAVECQPDLYSSHYFLGATYLVNVERDPAFWQLAVDHLLAALRVEPRYEPIVFFLALVALAAGDYDKVDQFTGQLDQLAASGRGMRAWFGPGILRGTLSLRRGRLEESGEAYLAAFDGIAGGDHVYREPIMALCACGASEVYLRLGRTEDAVAQAHRAWRLVSEFPRMLGHERVLTATLTALASTYVAKGDPERAGTLLQQAGNSFVAVARTPGTYMFIASTPELADGLGRAHLRCHRPGLARQFLDQAVRYGWRDEQWWRTDPQLAALRDTGALASLFASLPALPALVWQ